MKCRITVETKKGAKQELLFDIRQQRPYPSIEKGGCYRWRNGDGVFREYGNAPRGLSREYSAHLLRSDYTEENAAGNLKDFAGYEGAPGTVTLRGVDLGEMTIAINANGEKPYVSAKVRGFNSPTPGERAWIEANIAPALVAFVEEHKAGLYLMAVGGVEQALQEGIAEGHKELAKLEVEAKAAITALRARV